MSDHFGNIPIQQQDPSGSDRKRLKTKPRPTKQHTSHKKQAGKGLKFWLWPTICLLLLATYSIAGFFILPYYLTDILPGKISKSTDYTLTSGKVTFNPFTFRLASANGPTIYQAGHPVISLKSFTADLAPLLLLRNDLVCNAVTVKELVVNITRRPDGTYNFDDIFGRKNKATSSDIMNFSDLPFFFSLNNITIEDSTIVFHDQPTGKTHTINNIQLALPTLSNIPFQANNYIRPEFSAVVNGSPLKLSGQAHVTDSKNGTLATNLSCDINGLNLTLYSEYLPFKLPFTVTNGKANGTIKLIFNPVDKKTDKLSISFDLQITNAQILNQDKSISVTTPSINLSGEFLPTSEKLHIASVVLNAPQIRSNGDSLLKNIGSFLQTQKQPIQAGSTKNTSFSLLLDLFLIDNGTVQLYSDRHAQNPESTWSSVQLSVNHYSSIRQNDKKKDSGSFRFSGKDQSTSAYFSWQGHMTSPQSVNGKLTLKNFPAKIFFNFLDDDSKIEAKGNLDLNGKMSLFRQKKPATPFGVKLTDTKLTVRKFKLFEDKLVILSGAILKSSSFKTTNKLVHLGNVSLHKCQLRLPYKKLPKLLHSFSQNKYQFTTLDFSGNTIFQNKKGGDFLSFPSATLKINSPDKSGKQTFALLTKTQNKGLFNATGNIQFEPFSLSINTEFNGLPTKNIFALLSDVLFLKNMGGTCSGNGSISLPKRNYTGELRFKSARYQTKGNTAQNWGDIYFQGVNLSYKPFHLTIAEANFKNSELNWQITATSNNPMQQLASFLQKNVLTSQQIAKNKKISIPAVDIQNINFNNSRILIYDKRLTPTWEAEIQDFSGNISDIHSALSADKSKYSFNGLLDDSKFDIEGEIALFSTKVNTTYSLSVEAYPLTSFHKQLVSHTDINTDKGEFDILLNGEWQNNQFRESGSLTFSDIEPVSLNSDSALTIALLSNSDNMFKIDFDFSQPAEQKSPLLEKILSHFQTLVVKSSVSPLLLLDSNFTDLIGNECIEFLPGEPALSPEGITTLNRYIALLNSRPQIGLELLGSTNKEIDNDALVKQLKARESKRIDTENKRRYAEWQQKKNNYEKLLIKQNNKTKSDGKIAELDIPPAILSDYVPLNPKPITVNDDILLNLAAKRAKVVFEILTAHFSPQTDRIYISPLTDTDLSEYSPAPVVNVTLHAITGKQHNSSQHR